MNLKHSLDYHVGSGYIYGFTEFGGRRSSSLANRVLVGMVRGIEFNLKEAVAYYFSANANNVRAYRLFYSKFCII